jgi:fatty-acyl-CoA synthase
MRDQPFLASTVADVLDAVADAHGEREAIVFADARLTFRDFRERAHALARGLVALGVGRDDKVAIWLPNRPSWFVAQHACARLGAVVVALDPRWRAHELAYILAQSDARALVLTDHMGPTDYLEILHDVAPELGDAVPGELRAARLPELRWVLVDTDDEYAGCIRLRDVCDAGRDSRHAPRACGAGTAHDAGNDRSLPGPRPRPDDVFTLLYTSGTTGFPRGAVISHRNCVPHAWNAGELLRLTPEDRVLHALPAAGTWGGVNIPLSAWSHAAALVLMETFEPLVALTLVERERCTVWNAVDTMIRSVLERPDVDRFDRSTLRTGGFATTGGGGQGLIEAVVDRLGIPLAYRPYGTTEINAMALAHDLDEPVELRALAGIRPMPGIEVRVVRPDTGAECAPGDGGELQFRGPMVTRGYYRKPDETRAAFTGDGWFRSGDLGMRDAAGHVVVQGRLAVADLGFAAG